MCADYLSLYLHFFNAIWAERCLECDDLFRQENHLNHKCPVNNLTLMFNTSSGPWDDDELSWWHGRGRWWGALLRSSVIDVVASWLTRSLVCETTVLSRMFSSFLHFPNSLIHTFWFICLFFSYHWFPFSISHPARWHIITHLSWDKKFFKIPQESS